MITDLLIIFPAVFGSAAAAIWILGQLTLASLRRPRPRSPLPSGAARQEPPAVRDDFTLMA
jgi:hypothetical protein